MKETNTDSHLTYIICTISLPILYQFGHVLVKNYKDL